MGQFYSAIHKDALSDKANRRNGSSFPQMIKKHQTMLSGEFERLI
jgi:hypothetical protein